MEPLEQQKKVLLVFYSRTGATRKAAVALQNALGCEIEEITEVDSERRKGFLGYLRSFFEGIGQRSAQILPTRKNPGDYDLVVLGTPVWGSSVSSPLRAYLDQNRGRFKDVAFFLTHGGSGTEAVLREMQELSQRVPLATLALREKDLRAGIPVNVREFSSVLLRWGRPAMPEAA